MPYYPGQVLTTRATFTNTQTDTKYDPTTVKVKYRYKGRNVETLTYGVDANVYKDGTGSYHADIPLSSPGGLLYVAWIGEGTGATEKWDEVNVQRDVLI